MCDHSSVLLCTVEMKDLANIIGVVAKDAPAAATTKAPSHH